MKTTTPSDCYQASEVAEKLGVSLTSVIRWADNGKAAHLKPFRIGSRTFFPKTTVDAIISPKVA